MPIIKSSTELHNNYTKTLNSCPTYPKPLFITQNKETNLAVMSIKTYEKMNHRFELLGLIKEGLDDIETGNTRPFSEALSDIRSKQKR